MKRHMLLAGAVVSIGLLGAGCQNDAKESTDRHEHVAMADQAVMAMADIEPTTGNTAKGVVQFTQTGDKVKVVADISGLKPGTKHGFHIHEGTECGPDGMAAKGHYNPQKHKHGAPSAEEHHAGDFGNIEADAEGKAHYELTVNDITINGQKNPITGHAVIIHANPDDFSQPVGNAGPRIGCGIVKVAVSKAAQ